MYRWLDRMKKIFAVFAISLSQIAFAPPTLAQDVSDLQEQLRQLDAQIADAQSSIDTSQAGLIGALASMRKETLLLSRALVENRILASQGGAQVAITVPAVEPDPDRANELLGELAAAQKRIDDAKAEANGTGGLLQALALSRVEAERLTLAQLQMAYFQAKFGIALPAPPALPAPDTTGAPKSPVTTAETVPVETPAIAWADSRFPDIDYSLPPFQAAHEAGRKISGWWDIETQRAPVDDSPQVTAVNYSQYDAHSFGGLTALIARCTEGKTAFIFVQDDFLLSDFRRNGFEMTIRVDDAPALTTRWGDLTNSKGAGVFGAAAETFIRSIYDAKKLFVRLIENNGQQHDAVFDLSGGADAYESVASACGWTTLNLAAADYTAIQTLLNAGGFNAGMPDGQWGPSSREAMKRFQSSIGLEPTGAPDRETLAKLGL